METKFHPFYPGHWKKQTKKHMKQQQEQNLPVYTTPSIVQLMKINPINSRNWLIPIHKSVSDKPFQNMILQYSDAQCQG